MALATKPDTRKHLVRIAHGLTGNTCLHEDLVQEAMIHLWRLEIERPGQTLSWYLQNCAFHLRHWLVSGRSVDSTKRRSLCQSLSSDEALEPELSADEAMYSEIELRDLIRLLSGKLCAHEKVILLYLAEGTGIREIARRLDMSHPGVIHCRLKIAKLARKYGIRPPRQSTSMPHMAA